MQIRRSKQIKVKGNKLTLDTLLFELVKLREELYEEGFMPEQVVAKNTSDFYFLAERPATDSEIKAQKEAHRQEKLSELTTLAMKTYPEIIAAKQHSISEYAKKVKFPEQEVKLNNMKRRLQEYEDMVVLLKDKIIMLLNASVEEIKLELRNQATFRGEPCDIV